MSAFPESQGNGTIEEIFPDIFVVKGSMRMMPLMSIARNMTIVRHGDELTIFNSVRLNSEGEAALEKLGKPKHLVKLGFFHGYDDPYYRDKYKPSYWVARPKENQDAIRLADGPAPFVEGEVFNFDKGVEGEAAFIAPRAGGNVLITCDSVQNWVDTKGCSTAGAVFMKAAGFIEPAKIGPFWLKKIAPEDPSVMRSDFERLLAKDFERLLSGHGDPMKTGVKDALRKSIDKTFPAK